MGEGEMNMRARPLTAQEITKLVEKAQKEGSEETRYFLILSEDKRYSSGATWEHKFERVYGGIDILLLDKEDDGLATHWKYLLIPRTIPVIIIETEFEDFGKPHYREFIHVFTASGWKCVTVRE